MNFKDTLKDILKYLIIATFTVSIYFLFLNMGNFQNTFKYVTNITRPIIIGFSIAFILNILMNKVETKLFDKHLKDKPRIYSQKRNLSLLITILISFSAIFSIIAFLIPQLVSSVTSLSIDLPSYAESANKILNNLFSSLNINSDILSKLFEISNNLIVNLTEILSDFALSIIPNFVNIISNVTALALNLLISFVLAIYMLLDKESLINNINRVIKLFLSEDKFNYVMHIGKVVNKSFNSFVSGQITESIILGFLCFIGMTIFKFPFAFLISFIIGMTCLIPYFGAFIGTIPSFIIILISDPTKGIWFLLFAICLQQLEGSLIYPRVVGNSVGLPTIFVSIALIVGGNMFGFLGMILGVPTFASFYFLFREYVNFQEFKKGLDEQHSNIKIIDFINKNKEG
ncbi:MAG: AI-2E family transporter [Oscillospiraceae bacterium]